MERNLTTSESEPQLASQRSEPTDPNPPIRLPLSREDRQRFDGLVSTMGGGSPEWTVRRILRIQGAVLAANEIDASLPKTYIPAAPDAEQVHKRERPLLEVHLEKSWKSVLTQQQRALGLDVWSQTFQQALRTTCALVERHGAGQSISVRPHTLLLLQKRRKASSIVHKVH